MPHPPPNPRVRYICGRQYERALNRLMKASKKT